MNRLINRLEISDVSPKLTKAEWRRRLVAFAVGAFAMLACTFYAYKTVYLPYTWRSQVSQALQEIRNLDRGDADRFLAYPEMIKLELLAERLSYGPKDMDLAKRIIGVKAALELADHLGSSAARYLYGTTLLSGRIGMTDKQQALKQFEIGIKNYLALVNSGDARATLYYALMVNAGLGGLETNVGLSNSMVQQVMPELHTTDLIRLADLIASGSFVVHLEDSSVVDSLLFTLVDRGEDLPPYRIQWICDRREVNDLIEACIKRVNQRQVSKLSKPPTSNTSMPSLPVAADPEKQKTTGYINGAPQTAKGGMSTFSIDNKLGSSDAIGRLYKNGAKPAVRSMYVKAGETFKAQSLTAGSYVFRYRFIGSEVTYEADRKIDLTESRTETGTRFSNVTVTLVKEIGGNLPVKQVPADNF